MSDFAEGIITGAVSCAVIFVSALWISSLDGEISLVGIGDFVRVDPEPPLPKEGIEFDSAENLCERYRPKNYELTEAYQHSMLSKDIICWYESLPELNYDTCFIRFSPTKNHGWSLSYGGC